MTMTDGRKAEITALIDETIKDIQGANTIEELGLALEKFTNSRQDDEGDEQDVEWVLKLFGKKFGGLQVSEGLSPARSVVYDLIGSSLLGQLLVGRLVQFEEQIDGLVLDTFDELPN